MLLVDRLGNGGLERQLALVATSLPESWERRVWAMGGGPFATYLREKGIPVAIHDRRARYDPLPAPALWRELIRWRPDVVHSWHWMSTVAAAPMCRLLGIPLVDGMIQTGVRQPDHAWLKQFGMRCATLVAANTQAGLDAWNICPAKGRVLYNGFDRGRLPPAVDHRADDAARFTVIMTARMEPVKHYDVVIEAARQLSRESDGWRFVLVGEGSDRARLQATASELVRVGVVAFPQPRMEILELVRDADAGVLMTNPAFAKEGLSNSIMEYMALGLPVVCGDGGGNPELVLDQVTGFIVPPASPGDLADRLRYLRTHRAEGRAMGEAGERRIRECFSADAMVVRATSIYAEAMDAQGRRRRYSREKGRS
jgi:glycosyltransferase involved in cell wall biosynthesis